MSLVISRLFGRIHRIWVLDCQRVRRALGIQVSSRVLIDAYYGRHSARYTQHEADWAARQLSKESIRPMLTCALRWDGLGTGSIRAMCWHCGTEMTDPHSLRPCTVPAPDIKAVIRKEEEAYERNRERATNILAGDSASTITGDRLAYLHQTHGIDPMIAESVIGLIPESIHEAYRVAYQAHRETGLAGRKKIVVAAR